MIQLCGVLSVEQKMLLLHRKERNPDHLVQGCLAFGVSGPHWKKRSCLGPHIKYIVTHDHTHTQKTS